jgi:hypothetical protein
MLCALLAAELMAAPAPVKRGASDADEKSAEQPLSCKVIQFSFIT